jgi:hypothetical protein
MSSVLLKKGIHALRSNSLNNSLTKFFLSTEKELKSSNNNNIFDHKVYENKTKISLTDKIQFFNSKSIEYNYGWNNTSLLICSKSMNFFINNETGRFILLFGLLNICPFFTKI